MIDVRILIAVFDHDHPRRGSVILKYFPVGKKQSKVLFFPLPPASCCAPSASPFGPRSRVAGLTERGRSSGRVQVESNICRQIYSIGLASGPCFTLRALKLFLSRYSGFGH